MYINSMLSAVPKLKLMGLIVTFATILQILALTGNWFLMFDSSFSIKAVSDTYPMDMLGVQCTSIETPLGYQCFCSPHCEFLLKINANGWACTVIVLIAANCFLAELFNIRRKVWRCEGVNLPIGIIDNDAFIVIGTIFINSAVCLWFWQIFQIQEMLHEISLAGGVKLMVLACVMHIFATIYYFIKIRGETRVRVP